MDFAHGTTTLGFIFQGGVLLAVDSRVNFKLKRLQWELLFHQNK